jgi:hypothetical protein
MISRRIRSAGWAGLVLLSPVYAESPEPKDVPPDICDVAAVADQGTGDVIVSWSGGTPPFTVVRSDAADFRKAALVDVVASGIPSRRFVDRKAFDPDERLYYQVYDPTSPPDVFGFSPDGGLPGAEIRVRGVGFPSNCDEIVLQAGGVEVPIKLDCSFTGFVFKVPQNAVTGHLLVGTPAGVADAGLDQEMYCNGTPRHPVTW